VYDDHIFLCAQYDEYGYQETKTKVKRHIPLTAELVADLRDLMWETDRVFCSPLTAGYAGYPAASVQRF
jgi:hypothetical protein